MTYRLSVRARRDLIEIWRYIASDNESAADRFIDFITQRFKILGETPYAGISRDELRPGYRSFPVGQYVVFYRVSESRVQIMHVLHGKRDLEALFES
jgi:toxin ParE1/3/4